MWYTFFENSQELESMYNNVPELCSVRLMGIDFNFDQTTMLICFDLPTFADTYPEQWKRQGYNTVQIQIELLDLQTFNVKNWKGEAIVDIKIDELSDSSISLAIISSICNIQANALKGGIKSIGGYIVNSHVSNL